MSTDSKLPPDGFVRTVCREAPTRVGMARALMAHAMALLDEFEGLSEVEFVAVCEAYVPLAKMVTVLPLRVAWSNSGAQREPEG